MEITFNKILDKYNIEKGGSFYKKILHYNELVREFDGFWFEIEQKYNGFANLFIGENQINEKLEGYINIFIKRMDSCTELSFSSLIHSLKDYWLYLNRELETEYIYFQIIFECDQNLKTANITYEIDDDFKLLSYIIQKENLNLSNNIERKNKNLTIEPASEFDKEDIMDCLVKAYINATDPNTYSKIGLEKFKNNIRKYYTPLFSDERLILVCKIDGEFCGHVSFDLNKHNYYSGERVATLIDIFVLDEYCGLGIGNTLTIAGEQACFSLGYEKIVGTVDVAGNQNRAKKILDNLSAQGWINESVIYAKDFSI